jgi:pyruvate/2-oxoglutarate/acetoin dehydrogenase E1 component
MAFRCPVQLVALPSTSAPYSPVQEAEWLPGVEEIADAIRTSWWTADCRHFLSSGSFLLP